jgi:hypothetical protein
MHAMFTNIDWENKAVILSWLPAQGSKDVEISVSRD